MFNYEHQLIIARELRISNGGHVAYQSGCPVVGGSGERLAPPGLQWEPCGVDSHRSGDPAKKGREKAMIIFNTLNLK